MANTFADMMGDVDALSAVPSGDTQRQYNDYRLACMEAGTKPLKFDDWVAAGKPAGPK